MVLSNKKWGVVFFLTLFYLYNFFVSNSLDFVRKSELVLIRPLAHWHVFTLNIFLYLPYISLCFYLKKTFYKIIGVVLIAQLILCQISIFYNIDHFSTKMGSFNITFVAIAVAHGVFLIKEKYNERKLR